MKKIKSATFYSNPCFQFCFVLLALLLTRPQTAVSQACNRQQDSLELVQLYNTMNGPGWPFAWNLSQPMNNWWGVTLTPQGCVKKVAVTSNVVGQLPDLQLPHIEELQLWHIAQATTLSTLPNFSGMPKLKILDLNMNLTGAIPDFSNFPVLTKLYLSGNNQPTSGLTGLVPDFGNLPALAELRLTQNDFDAVPDFSYLPNLASLDLSLNQLNSVPDFSHIVNLQNLVLSANPLNNGVPDFSGLTNLKILTILDSDLDGSFPVFSHLPNLKELKLGGESLLGFDVEANIFGPIPDYDLPALENLVLQFVETSTFIPDFSQMPNLKKLKITGRHLSGTLPDFAHLPLLTDLQIGGYVDAIIPKFSNIGGSVPNFSNLPQLKNLDLCFNNFTGEPTNFTHLPQANKIDLSYNKLTGTIPAFSSLPNVDNVFLNNNKLTAISPQLNTPGKVKVSYNWLSFEDILPVLSELGTYSEQDTLPVQPTFTINANNKLEVDLLFDEQVAGSTYTWYKNTTTLVGTSDNNNFEFDLGTWSPNDRFRVTVTNPGAPQLTLVTQDFMLPLPSAADDLANETGIQVYPNPASTEFFIAPRKQSRTPIQFRITNASGQEILRQQPLNGLFRMDATTFAKGVYFIVFETGGKTGTQKLVIH